LVANVHRRTYVLASLFERRPCDLCVNCPTPLAKSWETLLKQGYPLAEIFSIIKGDKGDKGDKEEIINT
jgi:hypothetical protein